MPRTEISTVACKIKLIHVHTHSVSMSDTLTSFSVIHTFGIHPKSLCTSIASVFSPVFWKMEKNKTSALCLQVSTFHQQVDHETNANSYNQTRLKQTRTVFCCMFTKLKRFSTKDNYTNIVIYPEL